MKYFSERLKELRLSKNLSAKQLGDELNVSDSTIIRWENGLRIPNAENIHNIAVFFEVSADFLLGITDTP